MNTTTTARPGGTTPDPYERLRAEIAAGRVQEVIVAVPDLQGRLQGSRLAADHFLNEAAEHGFDACVYLLATDVEMDTGPGYAIDAWNSGFGDFTLRPDPASQRTLPWDEGTALVLADATWHDGTPVAVAPRHVLRQQLDRLAERGLAAYAGTELEFLVFNEDYQQSWDRRYHDLTPATRYNVDYALQGLSGVEPLVRRIRREMVRAGLRMETARAEVHPGQYEIVFRYDEAMRTCDNHVLFKNGAKEIAAQEGRALTFMPKFDTGEGNSCHVHLSLRDTGGGAVLADPDDPDGMSELMRHFVAGQLDALADFTLLMAPNVNSYKRLQPGAFAPTGIGWGRDNRTCPVRVVGSGHSLRIEHRVPGGDANPYLAVAAVVAAGLYGIENRLPLPEPHRANALADPTVPRLPSTLTEALHRWESSALANEVFGKETVAHYAQAARTELAAFESAVTDWERVRGFERL
ncbi:glutamine synthetase family protein [Streptomyces alkaliterrae]|uniref:Glutamine synthetase n=1 Tax=Streptomyces alkaliterrae TaxID=2213162 RepID=A0A5P0YXZ7_9ACTN|nr:glutamine synthetase family protein [Streptomyces alkaliterrae]MBB1261074.1 glutamine synthetase [Streptomyces alkaliterrae]MQS05153.1 glutamine synthetase [Streptomyces alkaliterrae]